MPKQLLALDDDKQKTIIAALARFAVFAFSF